jgi:hypothetical protein
VRAHTQDAPSPLANEPVGSGISCCLQVFIEKNCGDSSHLLQVGMRHLLRRPCSVNDQPPLPESSVRPSGALRSVCAKRLASSILSAHATELTTRWSPQKQRGGESEGTSQERLQGVD